MLKRLYSKRSGFTLVEIIVAFAVFAIMASMVIQILQLAINARNSNNIYAQELARQERIMTIVQKDQKNYTEANKTGEYEITFTDGDAYKLGYQVKAADPNATNQAEGINYFLSNIDYTCAGAADGEGLGVGGSDGGSGGMTQASRMDTRITGTAGIDSITIKKVIKDEYPYAEGDPFAIPEGHVRYFIEVAADSSLSMQKEDVAYAQYRLMFFSDKLNAAESAAPHKDGDDKEYTKDVYTAAKIVKVGHIDALMDSSSTSVINCGLKSGNTSSGDDESGMNPFLVQLLGANTVRIGTPFVTDWSNGGSKGVRFNKQTTRFYVEFDVSDEVYKDDPDVNLTVESFGYNHTMNDKGEAIYTACPQYEGAYNADGTPDYSKKAPKNAVHPCIYGAYLNTRHYTTTPAKDTE